MAQNNEAIPRTAFNKRAVKKVVFEKFLECTTAMMSRRRAEAQFDERSKLTQHFSGRKITFFSPSPPFFFSSKEYVAHNNEAIPRTAFNKRAVKTHWLYRFLDGKKTSRF